MRTEKAKYELQQSSIISNALKSINQKQLNGEDSERKGVFADYIGNRRPKVSISSKVKMNNRFMDTDFLSTKESSPEKTQKQQQSDPKTRKSILFPSSIGLTSLSKLQERMNEPIIDEDELKSIGSSPVVTDGDDLIEDAMDDLAQLDKDLDGSSSSDL